MTENNQTKSERYSKKAPTRGGARPNAGRKKGAATAKTRAIADKAAAEGITPLEVMLKTMSALMERAEALQANQDPDDDTNPLKLMIQAADVAKDAAPYMHPRLAAIDHTTNGKDMPQTSGVLWAPPAASEEDWESAE